MMKSILNRENRESIANRFRLMQSGIAPLWGEMTASQMVRHCRLGEETYLGKVTVNRIPASYEYGEHALEDAVKDDTPIPRHAKTHDHFIVTGEADFKQELDHLLALLGEYENYKGEGITHFFFGYMTREQVGIHAYKHLDHHLRQFGL